MNQIMIASMLAMMNSLRTKHNRFLVGHTTYMKINFVTVLLYAKTTINVNIKVLLYLYSNSICHVFAKVIFHNCLYWNLYIHACVATLQLSRRP